MQQQKITLGEMREMGVRGLLIYCSDYRCSHWSRSPATNGRMTPGCPISSRASPVRHAAGAALTFARTFIGKQRRVGRKPAPITPNGQPELETVFPMLKPSRELPILTNAQRLLKDAAILLEHRRFASAFALAVLGIEEIGKALIDGWNADAPLLSEPAMRSRHIQKQTAVVSLLLGKLARGSSPAANSRTWKATDLRTSQGYFNESEEGLLLLQIRDQQLDKRKQSAIYQMTT
jgi:AbiV family abortive infection protein